MANLREDQASRFQVSQEDGFKGEFDGTELHNIRFDLKQVDGQFNPLKEQAYASERSPDIPENQPPETTQPIFLLSRMLLLVVAPKVQ